MKQAHRRLREATAHAHETVDAAFGGYDLTDRDSYVRFLSAHAEVMVPLEAALDAAGAESVTPDWETRKRGHLILADLAALSAPPLPGRTEHVDPQGGAWHQSLSFLARRKGQHFDKLNANGGEDMEPNLAGILYVVEGSRLGGRFLSRQVPEEFPKSYLDAHQQSGNWAKLLASIDQILYDEGRTATAIDAALATFVLFERAGRNWRVKE
ncbi:biliverdin-producing heme oxygenase [Sphingomonas sp. AX6]|uniref:biliverdin-producing heme oxygenase n=1 Tax=Sphingomonas sp. AX6 TaxID=2653171 RepID=UPI0012F0D369|nr:biliverdin-producing heme oxygenase [Sphingomonas sp. AX6]VXC81426.1 Heme oxygenase [Sphingomonas sp. AX6]